MSNISACRASSPRRTTSGSFPTIRCTVRREIFHIAANSCTVRSLIKGNFQWCPQAFTHLLLPCFSLLLTLQHHYASGTSTAGRNTTVNCARLMETEPSTSSAPNRNGTERGSFGRQFFFRIAPISGYSPKTGDRSNRSPTKITATEAFPTRWRNSYFYKSQKPASDQKPGGPRADPPAQH